MDTSHWAENISHNISRKRFSGLNVAKLGPFLMLRSILLLISSVQTGGPTCDYGAWRDTRGAITRVYWKAAYFWVWCLHAPPALGRGRPCGHNAESSLNVRSWRWHHLEEMSKRTHRLFALPSGPQQGQGEAASTADGENTQGTRWNNKETPQVLSRKGRWRIM